MGIELMVFVTDESRFKLQGIKFLLVATTTSTATSTSATSTVSVKGEASGNRTHGLKERGRNLCHLINHLSNFKPSKYELQQQHQQQHRQQQQQHRQHQQQQQHRQAHPFTSAP